MQEDERLCPCCLSKNFQTLGEKNGFKILICKSCRTLFTDRLPNNSVVEHYDSYYGETNLQVPDFVRKRLREIIDEFSKYRLTNRLVDIGFGAGTLLEVASEAGWHSFGVEVNKLAVRQAEMKGFDVFYGELYEANYESDYFDVVTASEIIEHVFDPVKLLKEIHRILRPGGLLWMTTPSAEGISFCLLRINWTCVSPPEHLQIFSEKGIRAMLEDIGFTNIKIKKHGANPTEILNYLLKKNPSFDRVTTFYKINCALEKNRPRKTIKKCVNSLLNFTNLGDSLKIYATKS